MKKYINIFLIIIINFFNISFADQWDDVREKNLESGKTYNISSGTGFYVSPGYILTNQHIVSSCLTISVRGAVNPSPAILIAYDEDRDLALVKTNEFSPKIANLRKNKVLSKSAEFFVIGYPLEHSNNGKYLLKKANIISEEKKYIEFKAIIDKGNSGGPLIDENGNVVGIVHAKKNYYYLSSNNNDFYDKITPYQVHGLAINLTSIEEFLTNNNIKYITNDDNLNNLNPELKAKDYIVNIHCVKDKIK